MCTNYNELDDVLYDTVLKDDEIRHIFCVVITYPWTSIYLSSKKKLDKFLVSEFYKIE